jgi:hypothetical protein
MAPGGAGWVAPARSTHDWWRPTRSLATGLTWLLAAQAILLFVTPLVDDQGHELAGLRRGIDALRNGHPRAADRIFQDASRGSGLQSLLGLVTFVVVVMTIMWMWRSARNARALGRTGARLAPGWAIGAWFIPLANYVLLYVLWSDLWRSSEPDGSDGDWWRSLPGSALVRAFWSLYVVGVSVTAGAYAVGVFGSTGESTTNTLLAVGGALTAASAVLNIFVVNDVTSRQEALHERDPAPTSQAVAAARSALPVVPDDPGWYADPSGHFHHRYWDGTAWTEHVSRGGMTETAPVVPADWYPDPTRRFQWRYWTGDEWTEHASRGGDLFIDPLDGEPPSPASP